MAALLEQETGTGSAFQRAKTKETPRTKRGLRHALTAKVRRAWSTQLGAIRRNTAHSPSHKLCRRRKAARLSLAYVRVSGPSKEKHKM
jgi:hypothetical protein